MVHYVGKGGASRWTNQKATAKTLITASMCLFSQRNEKDTANRKIVTYAVFFRAEFVL